MSSGASRHASCPDGGAELPRLSVADDEGLLGAVGRAGDLETELLAPPGSNSARISILLPRTPGRRPEVPGDISTSSNLRCAPRSARSSGTGSARSEPSGLRESTLGSDIIPAHPESRTVSSSRPSRSQPHMMRRPPLVEHGLRRVEVSAVVHDALVLRGEPVVLVDAGESRRCSAGVPRRRPRPRGRICLPEGRTPGTPTWSPSTPASSRRRCTGDAGTPSGSGPPWPCRAARRRPRPLCRSR